MTYDVYTHEIFTYYMSFIFFTFHNRDYALISHFSEFWKTRKHNNAIQNASVLITVYPIFNEFLTLFLVCYCSRSNKCEDQLSYLYNEHTYMLFIEIPQPWKWKEGVKWVLLSLSLFLFYFFSFNRSGTITIAYNTIAWNLVHYIHIFPYLHI